jgi:hypothetical protein
MFRLSCPLFLNLTQTRQTAFSGCLVPAVLSCSGCPAPAVLLRLSCPGCPASAVLSHLSRSNILVPASPAPSAPSLLVCPGHPVLFALSRLTCQANPCKPISPDSPVSLLHLFNFPDVFFLTLLSWLSCNSSSCLSKQSCLACLPDRFLQLSCYICSVQTFLMQMCE